MSRLISLMNISLDGCINARDQSLEWQLIDEELHTYFNQLCAPVGGFIYGRKMYELMAAFWPIADQDPSNPDYIIEFARLWQRVPKTVVSTTMTEAPPGYSLIRDNVAAEVAALKAASDDDLMVGGPTITHHLARHGLVDVYQLFFHPVLIGSGEPMFGPRDDLTRLRLTDHRRFGSGVVYLEYQVAH